MVLDEVKLSAMHNYKLTNESCNFKKSSIARIDYKSDSMDLDCSQSDVNIYRTPFQTTKKNGQLSEYDKDLECSTCTSTAAPVDYSTKYPSSISKYSNDPFNLSPCQSSFKRPKKILKTNLHCTTQSNSSNDVSPPCPKETSNLNRETSVYETHFTSSINADLDSVNYDNENASTPRLIPRIDRASKINLNFSPCRLTQLLANVTNVSSCATPRNSSKCENDEFLTPNAPLRPTKRYSLAQSINSNSEQLLICALDAGEDPNFEIDVIESPYSRRCIRILPLLAAATRGQYNLVDLLIRAGAAINSVNQYNQTALHLACASQFVLSKPPGKNKLTISSNNDFQYPSIPSEEIDGPLNRKIEHVTTEEQLLYTIKTLVANGIYIDHVDYHGKKARDYAVLANYETLLAFLDMQKSDTTPKTINNEIYDSSHQTPTHKKETFIRKRIACLNNTKRKAKN